MKNCCATPLVLLAALLGTACSNTRLKETWTAPEIGSIEFETVMVLVADPDIRVRKRAEDILVAKLEGVEVIPSYQVIPNEESIKDSAKVKLALLANECDGIIVMRLAFQERDIRQIGDEDYPETYWDFYSYYHRNLGLSAYYAKRPEIYIDDVYGVETSIYDVPSDTLIWSGQTLTKRPEDIESLVREVTEAVGQKLRRQKLIR